MPATLVLPGSQSTFVARVVLLSRWVIGFQDATSAVSTAQYQIVTRQRPAMLFLIISLGTGQYISTKMLRLVPVGPCRCIRAVARGGDHEPGRDRLSTGFETVSKMEGRVRFSGLPSLASV